MSDPKKILILAANPRNTKRLRLDEEVREIEEGLRLSERRDLFDIQKKEAVRIRDLRRALLNIEPNIVHFCGHSDTNGIILEDKTGKAVQVSAEALADLFELCSHHVECVILNACYPEFQAAALNLHIKYVIGMQQEIGDKAAIEFAVGFYDALGAGKSIETAFKFGCSAIQMKNIPEHLTPVLKIKPDSEDQPQPPDATSAPAPKDTRIFISYKCDVEPDEGVAAAVTSALEQKGYSVFIDKNMPVGVEWGKRIDEELKRADFFIPLLSEISLQSEMLKGEIEIASYLARENNERPGILPVRLKFEAPFPYPVNVYLNRINWTRWDDPADTPRLIDELVGAISGSPLPHTRSPQLEKVKPEEIQAPMYAAQPLNLEMPEGTIDPESKFYVERDSDRVGMEAIKKRGVTITIKAPRQMGKSSLLMRLNQAARDAKKRVVFIDFQLFDKSALEDADTFHRQLCSILTDELELDDAVDEFWKSKLGNSMLCTRYMQRHILKQVPQQLVLAMDEVETLFDTEFRSDFFGMLRSWHNQRVAGSVWKRLDLALITSTEPYQLIENLNQSPFNVGEVISLKDFSAANIAALNQLHEHPSMRSGKPG